MTKTLKTIQFLLLNSFFIVSLSLSSTAQNTWSSDYVKYGNSGNLEYGADDKGNTIPDFSHVGYQYGDSEIPDIAVKATVEPADGDDGANIQAAINTVAALAPDANGFRGAVLIKKGTYQVAEQIRITKSGIVLRGEGQTEEGTVITATGTDQRNLIEVTNATYRFVDNDTKTTINEDYVPVGRQYVVLSDASSFAIGDDIVLYRPGTEKWITDIKMDQITMEDGVQQWGASSYSFYFERRITNIKQDTIFFRNPVVMAMETQYGGGFVSKYSYNRLNNIGVEDLYLKSTFTNATDEAHSWVAVSYNCVEHAWVRNVTSRYFANSCVFLERNAKLVTVTNCHSKEPKSIITGSRRYSFNLEGSLNLFKNCTASEGRHDYVTGSRVCGPNVFSNCTAENAHSDIGPHHRWAMGTLYDKIETDGAINVQDRDSYGSGHGWAGANQVLWNCKAATASCQSPWASAKNYNIGFQGNKSNGVKADRPDGVWEGLNTAGITPASLYEAQLYHRNSDTKPFAVLAELTQSNDSTYVIKFNMPYSTNELIAANFSVSGTAGAANKTFTITPIDEFSAYIQFTNLGVLEASTTIIVTASNITNTKGDILSKSSIATHTEADKRPVVNGLEATVNNTNGFLVASSNKIGYIYLVINNITYNTVEDLDNAVKNGQGLKVATNTPNKSEPLLTNGLTAGTYLYYAIDNKGRISNPDTKQATIEGTSGVDKSDLSNNYFICWSSQNRIFINENNNREYAIKIYSINGCLLTTHKNIIGDKEIEIDSINGLVIIQKVDKNGINNKMLSITQP